MGLPGSGKTTVGRRVADLLGAIFVDVDDVIERAETTTVARIFADRGEAAFRVLERDAVEAALGGAAAVIAPGGGWAAQPGALASVAGRAVVVCLETSPAVAARRVAAEGHRPLLAGTDPVARLIALQAARGAYYARADATVPTDGRSPEEIARDVVTLARSAGGW